MSSDIEVDDNVASIEETRKVCENLNEVLWRIKLHASDCRNTTDVLRKSLQIRVAKIMYILLAFPGDDRS